MPRQQLTVRRGIAAGTMLLAGIAWGSLDGNGQVLAPGQLSLVFATAPSTVRLTPDGREVLIEFAAPLRDGEANRAAKALGPLLEGYAEGYGALRLRLTAPARTAARTSADPKTVVIDPDPEPEPNPADRRRLAMLQAREQARAGNLDGAQVRLRQIAAETPFDPEPLLILADAQNAAGHWQRAIGLYDGARRLFPEATDIARDRDALSMSHAPTIRPEIGATFGPNGERAQTFTLTGDMPLGERWRGVVMLQSSHDEIRGLRRASSGTVADYSAIKLQASVGVTHDWDAPVGTTRLSVFAAPATAGAELKHDITTGLGDTTAGAIFHQPYWGTVTSFAANARRDQIGVAHVVKLPDQWQVQAGAGLIRYGIPGHDEVASGPTVLAGVSKGLPAEWLPLNSMTMRLGYRMEAEYLSHAKPAPTSAGQLPLLDTRAREIHSFFTEATAPLWSGAATALLGYAVDRYGGGGPQALLRLTSGKESDRFVFGAEAGVEPSLDLKPRTLFHLGFYSIWRFGGA